MTKKKTATVFAAASSRIDPKFFKEAETLGAALAEKFDAVYYGGGKAGMMGAFANAFLANGGELIGVIPKMFYDRGLLREGLKETIITEDLQTRERILISSANAAIFALPGGLGTLSELTQALVWRSLGIIETPIILIDAFGHFDAYLKFLDDAAAENFLHSERRALLTVANSAAEAMETL